MRRAARDAETQGISVYIGAGQYDCFRRIFVRCDRIRISNWRIVHRRNGNRDGGLI